MQQYLGSMSCDGLLAPNTFLLTLASLCYISHVELSSRFILNTPSSSKGSTPSMHIPGLPPEFMQAIVHQISQQAAAMATAASVGHHGHQPGTPAPNAPSGETPAVPPPPQARVVITRPAFTPRIPQPAGTRAATINLRASVPPTTDQQPAQVRSYCRHFQFVWH